MKRIGFLLCALALALSVAPAASASFGDNGGGSYYWVFTGVYGAPCPYWAPRVHVLSMDPAGQYLVLPLQFACN